MKKVTKMVVAAILTAGIAAGCQDKEKSQEIELFKMYSTDEGTYLLDPEAEFENVIFVEKGQAEDWNVFDAEHGTKVIGIFDEEGWELQAIRK